MYIMKKSWLAFMTVGLLEAAMFAGCGQATAPETGAAQESGQSGESTEAGQKGEETAVTMDEIWEANTAEALLAKHESVMATTCDGAGNTVVTFQNKDMQTVEQTFEDAPEKNSTYITNGESEGIIASDGEGNERFARILYAMEDPDVPALEELAPVIAEEDCLDRTISESTVDGDVLTVKAALDEEETKEELGKEFGLLIPEEYQGAAYEYVYTLNAETKELSEFVKVLKLADGTVEEQAKTEVVFDGAIPDGAQRIADLLEDSMTSDEDREITVISEPGTENEETFSFDIGRGISAKIICDEGYALFTDNIGKDLFITDDAEKDMTLYALPVNDIYPVSSFGEAGEELEDGVYSGAIDPESLKQDGSDWKVTAELFAYEQFSGSEIAEMGAGDVLYVLEKPVAVKSVSVLNGPSGKAAGVTVTAMDGTEYKLLKEDKIYYVKGEESEHQLLSLGSAEFAFSSDMSIVDTTRETPASDAEVTGIGDLPGSVQKSKNKDWSAAANDVILQGGKIVRIVRKEAE